MSKNNKKLEIGQLKAEVERLKKELKKKKKYGLVWEPKMEDVVELCKEKLPVLKEVKNKEIITDKNKPMNLLIEGDNYHALSVLNYTHAGKIDVIYIDPPYNTGNKDFKYNDKYVDLEDAYRHSKWLSFMDKRLKLAKLLLKDKGVIFISIDDNEYAPLKILCDQIFLEKNHIGTIVRRRRQSQANLSKNLSVIHEYIICYARSDKSELRKISPVINNADFKNPDNDSRGPYVTMPCSNKGGAVYEIITPTGKKYVDEWRFTEETYKSLLKDKRIVFPKKGEGKPRYKLFLREKKEEGVIPNSWWNDIASNQEATRELKDIFNGKLLFNNPKPVELMKQIIDLVIDKDGIVLDFFAGSGTTGDAVLNLNKDGGNRKFVLCSDDKDNNGGELKIVSDICYPRIKKVIEGYKNLKSKKVEGLDGNLKYFRTDFVDYEEPTDRNKIKLTEQATEMLCVREDTFESVLDNKKLKIFKNAYHYTGIIFDQIAIPAFKKAIKDLKGKFSVYVFSLGDETFDEEFNDIKQKVKLSPIPEAILRVYRRIFK